MAEWEQRGKGGNATQSDLRKFEAELLKIEKHTMIREDGFSGYKEQMFSPLLRWE